MDGQWQEISHRKRRHSSARLDAENRPFNAQLPNRELLLKHHLAHQIMMVIVLSWRGRASVMGERHAGAMFTVTHEGGLDRHREA